MQVCTRVCVSVCEFKAGHSSYYAMAREVHIREFLWDYIIGPSTYVCTYVQYESV